MAEFKRRCEVAVPVDALFDWHARPGALQRLIPPWERIEVIEQTGGIEEGARVVMRIRRGPLRATWVARHGECRVGRQFVDEQVRGPFAEWRHTHRFLPLGEKASALEDEVVYRLPLGALGRLFGGRQTRRMLERMFRFRHARTRHDVECHSRYDTSRRRVVITGASGVIGTALRAFLTTGGYDVWRLVRRPARPGTREIEWDPAAGHIDAAGLEAFDAVVHLAGANVASGRWTDRRKALIRDSRVDGTGLIARALAELERPPSVLISASAVGFYGDRGSHPMHEESGPGGGFLAEVCQAWEASTAPAAAAGIRVVHVRIGVVLSASGGALARLLLPFKAGLGGPIGGGRQFMSWIHLDDVLASLQFVMHHDDMSGPVNLTVPTPVDNRTLAKTLGRVLCRPALLPLPAAVVRLGFGQMGREVLLAGARVVPRRLAEAGFEFTHTDLEGALRFELGRWGRAGAALETSPSE